jgi:thiol:disulfide interchange protein DsbD
VAGGVALILPLLPRPSVAFESLTPSAAEGLARAGQPAMLDFSADWCLPCRELEEKTFHDGRVIAAAREFRTYRVDLTHFDSPEVQALRERWKIAGVPTIVFLKADGSEVADARVEGFLAPEDFLERMKQAR